MLLLQPLLPWAVGGSAVASQPSEGGAAVPFALPAAARPPGLAGSAAAARGLSLQVTRATVAELGLPPAREGLPAPTMSTSPDAFAEAATGPLVLASALTQDETSFLDECEDRSNGTCGQAFAARLAGPGRLRRI